MKVNPQKGIAILIAVIAVSAMLLIALAISDISFKEQVITYFGRDSKTAFYASNAGIECALFHDFGGGVDGEYVFATSTQSIVSGSIHCANGPVPSAVDTNDDTTITTFFFNSNDPTTDSCTIVKVSKIVDGTDIHTKIESRGYNNTCDLSSNPSNPSLSDNDPRNLERALLMTY